MNTVLPASSAPLREILFVARPKIPIMANVLGMVGAVLGGWLAGFFGGAVVVLLLYHGIRRAA